MSNEELAAMNLLIHTLVDQIDEMGLGLQLMEHLGTEQTDNLMKGYREYERSTGQR